MSRLAFVLIFFGLIASARGQEIEEAQGLDDLEPSRVADPVLTRPDWLKTRSYLSVLANRWSGETSRWSFPDFEWGNTLQASLTDRTQVFLDFTALSSDHDKTVRLFTNQIGLRTEPSDGFVVAAGKERSRRSPGVVVSPSDFLFGQTALPGQREDRRGIWLARASVQRTAWSLDLIHLAGDLEDDGGWLKSSERQDAGHAVRALINWSDVYINVLAGRRAGEDRAGLSIEAFPHKAWKAYLELGYRERSPISFVAREKLPSGLLGVSYEGSSDYAFKLEYLERHEGLDENEFETVRVLASQTPGAFALDAETFTPFLRRKYVISSFSLLEVRDAYNLIVSAIGSLEDDGLIGVLRGERLAGDHSVWALSFQGVAGGENSQYALRPFNTLTTAEFKYTF